MRKNRLKIVYVPAEIVRSVLFHDSISDGCIFLRTADLPVDFELAGVRYDFRRMAFAFKIRHSSFDEVPVGAAIPELDVSLRQYKIGLTSEQVKEIQKPLESQDE